MSLDKELKKSMELAAELEESNERITSLVSDLDGARLAQDEMRKGMLSKANSPPWPFAAYEK